MSWDLEKNYANLKYSSKCKMYLMNDINALHGTECLEKNNSCVLLE